MCIPLAESVKEAILFDGSGAGAPLPYRLCQEGGGLLLSFDQGIPFCGLVGITVAMAS